MQTYLFAFWNQLAYEFTNLYSKLDDKLHNTLVAIQENTEHITKNASESAKKIIDNQDKNTSDIKKNDDKNIDKALNGYDNSDMNNNSTNKLDEAFKKQDEAEKQATNKANEELKNFKFDNPIVQYARTFSLVGTIMQNIFNALDPFHDVVMFQFFKSVATIWNIIVNLIQALINLIRSL